MHISEIYNALMCPERRVSRLLRDEVVALVTSFLILLPRSRKFATGQIRNFDEIFDLSGYGFDRKSPNLNLLGFKLNTIGVEAGFVGAKHRNSDESMLAPYG